ncbi:hypothetical protein KY343_04525 [Candidatus Woesearchaeota archaeon]|nr:hypothetical protein [Candidatus Woesearchaeota archaeon]
MAITGLSVLLSLIITTIFVFLNALLLMASAAIFKLKDKSYKSALWVTAILGGASFIIGVIMAVIPSVAPIVARIIGIILNWIIVGILLALYLIKTKYNQEWGKAALVWLVYTAFAVIVRLIAGAILIAIFVSIGFGSAMLEAM